jgi:hypothetical protein
MNVKLTRLRLWILKVKLFAVICLLCPHYSYAEPYRDHRERPLEDIVVISEVIELDQDPSYLHIANLSQNQQYALENTLKQDETEYHKSQKKELNRLIRSLHRLSAKTETLELRGWATEDKKPVTIFIQDKKLITYAKKLKSGDLVYCKTKLNRREIQLAIGCKKLTNGKTSDEATCLYFVKDKDTVVRSMEVLKQWREKYSRARPIRGQYNNYYGMHKSHTYLEAVQLDTVFKLTEKGELPPNSFQNNWTIIPVPDTSPFLISIKACDNDDTQLLCASLSSKDDLQLVDLYDLTFEVIEISSSGREKVISPIGGIHMGGAENGCFGHYDSSIKRVVVIPANRTSDKSYKANVLEVYKYDR